MIFISAPTIGIFRSGTFRWWEVQMGSHCAAKVCPAFCNGFRRDHLIGSPEHSLDFWLTSEDLPLADNRIFYEGAKVRLDLTQTNAEAHERLKSKLRGLCDKIDLHPHLFERSLYLGQNIPIGGTAHQAGTLFWRRPEGIGP